MEKRSKVGLFITATLFVGWIAYLGYLAADANNTVVLSRPQIMEANAVIIAKLSVKDGKPDTQVEVVKVQRIRDGEPKNRWLHFHGQTITIENLPDCWGWKGPGEYIIPLDAHPGGGIFRVVELTSRSPGYNREASRPFIYPFNSDTDLQLQKIPEPKLTTSDE